MVAIYTLNAFTNIASGGNPAGVVLDASALDASQMQKIAHELGYAETAFVQPSGCADFKIRFFTPCSEVDLCGHATIATFSLLRHLGRVQVGRCSQETKAGILEIQILDSGKVLMTQSQPVFSDYIEPEDIVKTLNCKIGDLHFGLRPQIVSTGLRDVIVPVRDLKSLNEIEPDFKAVSALSRKLNIVGYHLFSMETLSGASAQCRNFAPLYDIPEEAATGTASGALACYLFKHRLVDVSKAQCLVFEQGYSMSRPSRIEARLEIVDDEIKRVEVGGFAYLFGVHS